MEPGGMQKNKGMKEDAAPSPPDGRSDPGLGVILKF
jgi:hypothetical protein